MSQNRGCACYSLALIALMLVGGIAADAQPTRASQQRSGAAPPTPQPANVQPGSPADEATKTESRDPKNPPQARVVGIPTSIEGRLDQGATVKLGDRLTVRIEVWPSCLEEKDSRATNRGAGNPTQPSTSNASDNPQNENGQQREQAAADDPSWIPGLKYAEILKLIPYLNARPLKGIYPESVDPEHHTLTFHLSRTPDSEKAWMDLLSNPGVKPLVMTFSVGLEGQPQFPTCVNTLNLVVIPIKWFVIAMAGLLVVVYIFFRLAMRTALLRDAGPSQGISNLKAFWQPRKPDNDLGPFSLARTQMAFWFFMVLASFLVIWLITGDTDTITTGVLVLIGISAGTALGSTAIDSSRRSDATQPPPTQKSEGFLNDILSEGKKGVSFHRFQIAIWTIVLGFVFLRSVLNDLAMPDFDANLLTLMGISSGTYLGLKLPEQPASQPPAGEQEPKEDNKPRTREKRMT